MLTRKCSHHFRKNVDEKVLTTIQKNIIKKIKSQNAWVLRDLNKLSGLFWVFLGFIVTSLIHLPEHI
jgi:hypothetical protein